MSLSAPGEILRQYDRDRFLTTLFAPAERREALFALYAFNHEIAKTREVVTETTMGLIRLTWWREAIEEIYAGKPPRAHEVVEPLAQAIRDYNLPQDKFEKLIYAREFDVEDAVPSDMAGLKNYADYTMTPLLELSHIILSGQAHSQNAVAAAQVIVLTGLLRAVPFHARQGRCYLPETLLAKIQISPKQLYTPQAYEVLVPLIQEVVEEIDCYLPQCQMIADIRPVLLQVSRAKQFIAVLKKRDYNILHPQFQGDPPFSVLRLIWNYSFRKI